MFSGPDTNIGPAPSESPWAIPPFEALQASVHCFMLLLTHRTLELVNSDVEGWLDQVRDHIAHGTNFLLILRNECQALKNFCNSFELPDDCKAHVITHGQFFLLSPHVAPNVFDA